MKRRFRLSIAIVAGLLQALAPFAAYAAAQPGSGAGDICSVVGRTQAAQADRRSPSTGPVAPGDHRPMAHCAYCPGGSAAAAVLPPAAAPVFQTTIGGVLAPMPKRTATAAAPVLLPPSRGPPAFNIPV